MLILEYPHNSTRLVMLARSGGSYTRPIVGYSMDLRLEDFMPLQDLGIPGVNFVAQLPNSGQFIVCTFNTIDTINATSKEAKELLNKKDSKKRNIYCLLPSSPEDTHWDLVGCPWWEFAEVYDEYGAPIKAPKIARSYEKTAEQIDERLDDYPSNRGKTEVLSPITLDKLAVGELTESYLHRLRRI